MLMMILFLAAFPLIGCKWFHVNMKFKITDAFILIFIVTIILLLIACKSNDIHLNCAYTDKCMLHILCSLFIHRM